MFKKEFVEKMKNDEELQELRRKVLSFSEKWEMPHTSSEKIKAMRIIKNVCEEW